MVGRDEWLAISGTALLVLGIAIEFSIAWSAIVLGLLLVSLAVIGMRR